ncbi:reverse transcriptase domain-containing protein [Hymenobacter daeguensis]
MFLNLALAWKRLRAEIKDRGFVVPPFEVTLIENKLQDWLATIESKLVQNIYNPTTPEICDVPKGKHLVRPGTLLSTEDLLVYYAIMGEMFNAIHDRVDWARYKVDCSNIMNSAEGDWILHYYRGWSNFRTKSLSLIKEYKYVVVTDISGFFENIDHAVLLSDVRSTGVKEEHIRFLRTCLDTWAMIPGKGLPQGCVPSDILAKLYLDSIDRLLYNEGYKHARYVDDIRVFCSSYQDAKRAVVFLASAMRKKGLILHSGKTEILDAEEAKHRFEHIDNIIADVTERAKQKKPAIVKPVVLMSDDYNRVMVEEELPVIAKPNVKATPVDIIKEAFSLHILADPTLYNKTIYHFLLKRLGEAKDDFAADHCVYMLSEHPEETGNVLAYLDSIDYPRANSIVASYFCSEETVYCYQNYQLISWLNNRENLIMPWDVICRIRAIAFNPHSPRYLKSVARKFIGNHGDISDFERLEELCKAATELEQAELICCLVKHEKGRRNTVFKRLENVSYHNKSAIAYVSDTENRLKIKARKK